MWYVHLGIRTNWLSVLCLSILYQITHYNISTNLYFVIDFKKTFKLMDLLV